VAFKFQEKVALYDTREMAVCPRISRNSPNHPMGNLGSFPIVCDRNLSERHLVCTQGHLQKNPYRRLLQLRQILEDDQIRLVVSRNSATTNQKWTPSHPFTSRREPMGAIGRLFQPFAKRYTGPSAGCLFERWNKQNQI
jgi:hypothetical protein